MPTVVDQKVIYGNPASVPLSADDAVGVANRQWYVAVVNHNNELNVRQKLSALDYDCYVASQTEARIRKNGKRQMVERLVIPSKVFVHCTEPERRQLVTLPYINRFMTNPAANAAGPRHPLAVIPGREMDRLRFMLGQSDTPVTLTSRPFVKGDRVRVVRGSLCGLEGEITNDPDGTHALIVGLNLLGYVKVSIIPTDVEKI